MKKKVKVKKLVGGIILASVIFQVFGETNTSVLANTYDDWELPIIGSVDISHIVIDKQPVDYTGKIGETAKFAVTASGSSLKYEWQASSDNGKTWNNATGATGWNTSNMSVQINEGRTRFLWRVKVTDGNGNTAVSNTVRIKQDIVINKQPIDYTGKIGETAKFAVTASGSSLKYEWQASSDNGKTWNNATGATGWNTSNMSVQINEGRTRFLWRVKVTDGNGNTAVSNTVRIKQKS